MTTLTHTRFSEYTLDAFRAALQGTVTLPSDPAYDDVRRTWNTSIDQHPAIIVQPETAEDAAYAVQFAAAYGLGIAVQATGHGVIRVPDDAMLIVTDRMNRVSINAAAQTATIGAGVKWGAVLEPAQQVGLAPLLGSSPTVGAIGYTLGGGMGWLARKYGMAIDSVLEFEVVTASGEILRVSEAENAELFWALRGGGKGLGLIVTEMTIRLYPVTTVFGGTMIFPISEAREVFRFYRDWIQYLPEEWTTSIAVMNMPPIPELPPFLSGKSVVMVNGCYAGDPQLGAMMLSAWDEREGAKAIVSSFRPMPFSEVGTISNDPQPPSPGLSSGAWLNDMSDESIDVLLAYAAPRDGVTPPVVKTEVRYAGGAIARADAAKSSYGHRDQKYVLNMIAMVPTPEIKAIAAEYLAGMKAALTPRLNGEYANFLDGEEARSGAKHAFSAESFARLAAIKAQIDPQNRFRFGFDFNAK